MLKLKGNYVSWGWNFDNDWEILETESFPYKKYQAAPPVIKSTLESHDTSISGQSLNGGTVYMYYRDREAISTTCNGHDWVFETDALQSGAQVQLYADVAGMTPSYLTSSTVKYPGSGTEDDPWRIYTAEDLQGAINSGYYIVMNNINLTSWINENSPVKGWPAVGRNSSVPTFIDGDGHKISGLWIDTDEDYNGLFSNYSAGYIKNLNVEVAEGKKVKGGNYTGILIGRMANGQIINCSVKGEVEAGNYAGGLAGYAVNSELTSSHFVGTLTGKGEYVGGLAAQSDNSNISLCSASGTITSTNTGNTKVGGLVGSTLNGGTVSKSFANVTVTANGTGECGGLAGHNDAVMTESYSEGTITSSGEYTGGLIGLGGNVSNSYSTANVNGGGLYTAGLVGYTYGAIDKCYASGNVNGVRYGAGLVGELDGASAKATNNIAANNLVNLTDQSAWGCRVIGGYKNGAAEPTLRSNYALSTMQVSLNNVPQKKTDDNIEGVARTADELKSASLYKGLGWDLTKVWMIEEGNSYPILRQSADAPSFPEGGNDDGGNSGDGSNIKDTDIAAFPNVMYVENMTISAGHQITLPVRLKNQEFITAFSFEMTLPKGMTVAKDSRNRYLVALDADRKDDSHSVSTNIMDDGTVNIACLSAGNETFLDHEGVVLNITVDVAESMKPGDYALLLRNINMSTPSHEKLKMERVKSTITVAAYTPGDVDEDGDITINDAVGVVSFVIKSNTTGLNEAAADADGDGEVTINDAVWIVSKVIHADNNVKAQRAKAQFGEMTAALRMDNILLTENPYFEMPVRVEGTADVTASQFVLALPKGVRLVEAKGDADHAVAYEQQLDGSIRIASLSASNAVINNGTLMVLRLQKDATFEEGDVTISEAMLVSPTLQKGRPAAVVAHLSSDATAIAGVTTVEKDKMYDLTGRKIQKAQHGVYIVNSKKMVK